MNAVRIVAIATFDAQQLEAIIARKKLLRPGRFYPDVVSGETEADENASVHRFAETGAIAPEGERS